MMLVNAMQIALIVLTRDLTDAMYNPYRPPYVSHEEGTRLIIEYIEKFWCPTMLSSDLTTQIPKETSVKD